MALFLKPVFPVLDYILNYNYISTVLCENKDKPKLNCCGKCHLKKELAKASEGEKPIQSNKKNNNKQEIENLFFHNINYILSKENILIKKNSFKEYYSNIYSYMNSSSVFHPPNIS